jgi:hypothetical protein
MDNNTNDNPTNYKDEDIEKKLFSPKKLNIPYLSLLLEYTAKNEDFLEKNPDLFKKAITGALNDKQIHNNLSNINKVKGQIISFLGYAIEHKDKYNNDWLTCIINEYFRLKLPPSKDFQRKLDNFANKLSNLDFSANPMSEAVRNIAYGNSPIELYEPITFFCKLDTRKLSYQTGISLQSLYCNFRIGFDFLKELVDKEPTVSFRSNFTETNEQVFSIVVLHHSQELQDKIPKFIKYICYDIDHSIDLTREKMDSIYLRFEMESEMSHNSNTKKKIMKI